MRNGVGRGAILSAEILEPDDSVVDRFGNEVRDVVCQECWMLLSGEDELVGIGGSDTASFLRREDIMAWREPWDERHLRG
jgi:hypothetical protein